MRESKDTHSKYFSCSIILMTEFYINKLTFNILFSSRTLPSLVLLQPCNADKRLNRKSLPQIISDTQLETNLQKVLQKENLILGSLVTKSKIRKQIEENTNLWVWSNLWMWLSSWVLSLMMEGKSILCKWICFVLSLSIYLPSLSLSLSLSLSPSMLRAGLSYCWRRANEGWLNQWVWSPLWVATVFVLWIEADWDFYASVLNWTDVEWGAFMPRF